MPTLCNHGFGPDCPRCSRGLFAFLGGVALAILILLGLALFMPGCVFVPPVDVPGVDGQALCLKQCEGLSTPIEQRICGLACMTPPPPPTATATSTPTVAPTSSPTAAPTATPTMPSWSVRLNFYEGFHSCNPYPCNPLDPACAAQLDEEGRQRYPVRTSCAGDRTPMCIMPGFDYPGLEKGAGCRTLPLCMGQGEPDRTACINRCLERDSPGTPCGGAASCDPDHLGCPRTFVGCQGKNRGDVNGSRLTWTGLSGCTEGPNHYGFTCTGTPGTTFQICTEPYPNATNEDGSPLLGGTKHCKDGWF